MLMTSVGEFLATEFLFWPVQISLDDDVRSHVDLSRKHTDKER